VPFITSILVHETDGGIVVASGAAGGQSVGTLRAPGSILPAAGAVFPKAAGKNATLAGMAGCTANNILRLMRATEH